MAKKMTYAKAGVNITLGDDFVDHIIPLAKTTNRTGNVGSIGGFGALFAIPKGYKEPLLVSSTDGVGTKLLITNYQNRFDTIGQDLVAMCVNDLVVCGAEPLFFLDYYATGKLGLKKSVSIMKGIVAGCRDAHCALIGGETAEMPGIYKQDDFDLAGFTVGVVERKKIIDGSTVKAGDRVIGIHSSGIHSNGYSLVRKLFSQKEMKGAWGKTLLVPTKIYVRPLLALAKAGVMKAAAHITGGGFYGNIPRSLPSKLNVVVDRSAWTMPNVFTEMQKRSGISDVDLFTTFNCGIGMTVTVAPQHEKKAHAILKRFAFPASTIGTVVKGKGEVVIL